MLALISGILGFGMLVMGGALVNVVGAVMLVVFILSLILATNRREGGVPGEQGQLGCRFISATPSGNLTISALNVVFVAFYFI